MGSRQQRHSFHMLRIDFHCAYQRTSCGLRQRYGFGTTRTCTNRVKGKNPIIEKAQMMCNFTIQGMAAIAVIFGFNVRRDQRYGVAVDANQLEPHPLKIATYNPEKTCMSNKQRTIQSAALVTMRIFGSTWRRMTIAINPTNVSRPKINPEASRMYRRNGALFHAKISFGKRNATKCPVRMTIIP